MGTTSASCGGATCTSQSCDRIGTHTGAGCIATSANCAAGYGIASTTSTAGAASSDCNFFLTTHALNAISAAATTCIARTVASGGLCATGYTDKSDGTAATAVGGTLADDCKYCVASSHAYNAKFASATKCVAKTIASNDGCLAGYTDKSDGTAANTVTLEGPCEYCVATTH